MRTFYRTLAVQFVIIFLSACAAAQPAASIPASSTSASELPKAFDGTHAFNVYLMDQVNIGFRPAGSAADRATGDYILKQLQSSGVSAVTQEFTYRGVAVRNVIGKIGEGRGPLIIIGAHYDTRKRADQDKVHPEQPVMGANDGASGVAVLLELARTLDASKLKNELWLAFFDAEDDGDLGGCVVAPPPCDDKPWPWSVGADYVAEHVGVKPESVVVIDMIGDKDQNIYYEYNSDKELQQQIWGVADKLGYSGQFISQYKWSMDDDHTPFLQRGMRAIDIIDFDYPYWHTTEDTADKCSPESLGRVGEVLKTWLESK